MFDSQTICSNIEDLSNIDEISLALSTFVSDPLVERQTSNCNFEMNLTPFIGNRRQRRLSNSALAMYHKSAEMLLHSLAICIFDG